MVTEATVLMVLGTVVIILSERVRDRRVRWPLLAQGVVAMGASLALPLGVPWLYVGAAAIVTTLWLLLALIRRPEPERDS